MTNSRMRFFRLKNFGRRKGALLQDYSLGYNFKFNDILASIGIAQIKSVRARIQRKSRNYELYHTLLGNLVEFPPIFDGNLLSVIDVLVENPIDLQKYLSEFEIETRRFYPPIHQYYGLPSTNFPSAVRLHERGLWLSSSSKLSDYEITLFVIRYKNILRKNHEN